MQGKIFHAFCIELLSEHTYRRGVPLLYHSSLRAIGREFAGLRGIPVSQKDGLVIVKEDSIIQEQV